jgi:nicotinate-nucleotide adenylyltransferase
MRVAIFGGTFDPVHCGHLIVAREAAGRFSLDRVVFVPAGDPPHKRGAQAPFEARLRMLQLACAGESGFDVSDVDNRPGKSYSVDTIARVRASLALEDELLFIIGADAFAEIGSWYRWRDVVRAVEFIVVARPGHTYDVPDGAVVHRLDSLALTASSSEIRAALARGERPSELPDEVYAYIREHGLYRAPC